MSSPCVIIYFPPHQVSKVKKEHFYTDGNPAMLHSLTDESSKYSTRAVKYLTETANFFASHETSHSFDGRIYG